MFTDLFCQLLLAVVLFEALLLVLVEDLQDLLSILLHLEECKDGN